MIITASTAARAITSSRWTEIIACKDAHSHTCFPKRFQVQNMSKSLVAGTLPQT